jgi:hypothetical protein
MIKNSKISDNLVKCWAQSTHLMMLRVSVMFLKVYFEAIFLQQTAFVAQDGHEIAEKAKMVSLLQTQKKSFSSSLGMTI